MIRPPLFAALEGARSVLIAGAGGGFDVYAGLPLFFALREAGTGVHLANLSFTELDGLDLESWVEPELAAVTPASHGPDAYFPERTLARWLAANNLPSTVYAFPRLGVRQLRDAYRTLVTLLDVDATAATRGAFGDVQFTTRTAGSELFINPLMSIYFTVRLDALARRNLYLDRLEGTTDTGQVSLRIEEFREEISPRIPRAFPH